MPSNVIERPEDGLRVARRYLRRERLLSGRVIVTLVSLFLLTYVVTSLLPAAIVGVLLVVIARAPILQSKGTVQLRTDEDRETVIDSFTCPKPPILALQWGVADEVIIADGTPKYPTAYFTKEGYKPWGMRGANSVTQDVFWSPLRAYLVTPIHRSIRTQRVHRGCAERSQTDSSCAILCMFQLLLGRLRVSRRHPPSGSLPIHESP